MSEQKLVRELDQIEIKQTSPIRFKDDAINKIRKQNIVWNKRTDIFIPFKVSKDSQKIIDIGIRTPIEIVMSFSGCNNNFTPRKMINL